MDWGKDMECSGRQEMESCVYQLVRASLLLKLLRSTLSFTIISRFCKFGSLQIWTRIICFCYIYCTTNFASNVLLSFEIFYRFKDRTYGSSGATSGLTSSLAFTPVQVCYIVTMLIRDICQQYICIQVQTSDLVYHALN